VQEKDYRMVGVISELCRGLRVGVYFTRDARVCQSQHAAAGDPLRPPHRSARSRAREGGASKVPLGGGAGARTATRRLAACAQLTTILVTRAGSPSQRRKTGRSSDCPCPMSSRIGLQRTYRAMRALRVRLSFRCRTADMGAAPRVLGTRRRSNESGGRPALRLV